MFTLDEINTHKSEYVKYSKNNIPMITNVIYDLTNGTMGQVNSCNITSDDVVLHLNPELFTYNSKYQIAVLWHEFTHIYDKLNYDIDPKYNSNYTKTISEIRATMYEMRFLLGMKSYDKILYDTSKKIYFMNYHPTIESVIIYYDTCCKNYFEKLKVDLSPYNFNNGFNNFMYLCGLVKLTYHDKDFLISKIKTYPAEYHPFLNKTIESIYNNNDVEVCNIYNDFKIYIANQQIASV